MNKDFPLILIIWNLSDSWHFDYEKWLHHPTCSPPQKTWDPILTIAPLSDLHCYYVIPTDCWQSPFNASLGSWKVSDTTQINYWKTSFFLTMIKKERATKEIKKIWDFHGVERLYSMLYNSTINTFWYKFKPFLKERQNDSICGPVRPSVSPSVSVQISIIDDVQCPQLLYDLNRLL